MLEIKSNTYIDKRSGEMKFQLTMNKDGRISSIETDYKNIMDKNNAEKELCNMLIILCERVYNLEENKPDSI